METGNFNPKSSSSAIESEITENKSFENIGSIFVLRRPAAHCAV